MDTTQQALIVINLLVLGYIIGDLTGWRQGYKKGVAMGKMNEEWLKENYPVPSHEEADVSGR